MMFSTRPKGLLIYQKYVFNEINLWPFRWYGKTKKDDGKKKPLSYYTVINRFIESVDIIMTEDIDPDSLSNKHLKESYFKYCELLERDKYLDFSSMIYILVKSLENKKEILEDLNERVKHLVVDEYQDVNRIQERLIKLISIGAKSVCVVGDDDQCIYQWRGSYVDNIISFKERYSKYGVTDIPLDVNFRSTKAVVHTARKFIENNTDRLTLKNMTHSDKLIRKYEKGDIIYHHLETEEEEHEFILKKINSLLGTDFTDKKNKPFSLSEGDFAVLVRTNQDLAHIVEYLDSKNVECIAYSGGSIFERKEVLLAMDCLAYLFRCKTYNYKPIPFLEDLEEGYKNVFSHDRYPESDVDSFVHSLKILKGKVDRIFDKEDRDYLGDLGLQAIYHEILSCFGAQNFEFSARYNYNLAVLSTAISDYESVWIRLRASEVEGFFQFAKAYGESNYMDSKFADSSKINAVKVLTIHKAKGLEFPVVFIPGLVKKRKNKRHNNFVDKELYDFDRYVGTEEDERRLFYTALTRSEKYIFITSTDWKINKNKNPYKKHPFIDELDFKYISEDMNLERSNSGYVPRLNHRDLFSTSFSELTTYDRCPHDFELRHVFGYNAGVPAAFGYGTNIHNILNAIHNNFIKTQKIPTENEIDQIFKNMFHLRYATPKIKENMEKGAKKVVKNYVNLQKDEFRKILETEKRFEFVIEDALINGQIDLLKKIDEKGNVEEVEIIDFKTENDSSLYRLDHEKQLRLYAIACLESLGLSPQKACVHHLDEDKRVYVDISKKKLEETKYEIKNGINNILNKKFIPKVSKNCKNCDYGYICSDKGYNKKF